MSTNDPNSDRLFKLIGTINGSGVSPGPFFSQGRQVRLRNSIPLTSMEGLFLRSPMRIPTPKATWLCLSLPGSLSEKRNGVSGIELSQGRRPSQPCISSISGTPKKLFSRQKATRFCHFVPKMGQIPRTAKKSGSRFTIGPVVAFH